MRKILWTINIVFILCFISCATVEEDVIEENDIIFSVMPEAIEINDNHLKLSQMNFHYKMPSTNTKYSISKNELNTILKEKTFKRTRIYVDKAISDINLMFKAYANCYAPYFYLGGDKEFDACKAEIIDTIKTNYDTTIPTNELVDIIYSKLSVILDSHSKIGGKSIGNNNYRYYYCNIKLKKVDEYYYLESDANLRFECIDNQYAKVGLSMNSEGEIFYSLIQHCSMDYHHKSDIAYFQGELNNLVEIKIDWIASNTKTKSKEIYSFNEKDGIAYIEINTFSDKVSSKELQDFVNSGKKVRDAKAIILDLRGNGGGTSIYIESWIRNLTGKNPSVPRKRLHRVSEINKNSNESNGYTQKNTNGKYIENKIPIFVLVDNKSASAAEAAVEYFKCMRNAFIIGSNTAGYLLADSGSGYTMYLPNSKISFSFGQNMFLTFSKETLDKVGYEPDIWINPKDSLDAVFALIDKISNNNCAIVQR